MKNLFKLKNLLGFTSLLFSLNGMTQSSQGKATVTFFSEGYWGRKLVTNLTPTSEKSTIRWIPHFTLKAKGLDRAISTARLTCGNRIAKLVVFDYWNNNTSGSNWKGNYKIFSCTPNQTKSIDFHKINSFPKGGKLGDRVLSAVLMVEARDQREFPFSRVVKGNWDRKIKSILGSEAKPRGEAKIKWLTSNTFEIKQDITAKISWWPDYKASFSYKVLLRRPFLTGRDANKTYPQFKVLSHTVWVSGGTFHGRVKKKVRAKVRNGYAKVNRELNQAFKSMPKREGYYLSPGFDLEEIFLNSTRN